jgi:hypothetical protein
MRGVRHPHPGQVAGPVQDRQLLRVAPVGLDPLAWLARNQRGCCDRATVAQRCELAVDVVPATAGVVAEVQLAMLRKSLRHLRDVVRLVRDDANKPHRAVPPVSATLIEMVSLTTTRSANVNMHEVWFVFCVHCSLVLTHPMGIDRDSKPIASNSGKGSVYVATRFLASCATGAAFLFRERPRVSTTEPTSASIDPENVDELAARNKITTSIVLRLPSYLSRRWSDLRFIESMY